MKKKILIIAPYQFGELSDCYYWAKYATMAGWDVTYIGYKYKNRNIKERSYPDVKVKSVNHYSNRILLGMMFYLRCIIEIILRNHNNVIVGRMPLCQCLPALFPKRNIILDVRTLSVSKDMQVRQRQDEALRSLKRKFAKCTVISEGVGDKIGKPFDVLPLGAEELSLTNKSFDKMRLFYIGTFDNRNLSTFIEGLALYQKATKDDVFFDIVGGGSVVETEMLKNTIKQSRVKNVTMHGYLTHEEAKEYFDHCNVGVCFVPVTDYYQYQPPTKLYEYLLSGMIAISTNTFSNCEVMNEKNGVVVSDNALSVYEGLKKIAIKFNSFSSNETRLSVETYHWREIVGKDFLTLFK